MYRRPGVVYAFHGCDRRVAEEILNSHTKHLKPSENKYDWLGSGIYFWECSPERALAFAIKQKEEGKVSKGKINDPYVIGAAIELGNCLNLLDDDGLKQMKIAHEMLSISLSSTGEPLPENHLKDQSGAYRLRELDCAVIEMLHKYRRDNDKPGFDTVLSALWEGNELYPGAGLKDKNHIQICVVNPACIRGYFRVREIDGIDLNDWNNQE